MYMPWLCLPLLHYPENLKSNKYTYIVLVLAPEITDIFFFIEIDYCGRCGKVTVL